MAKLRYNAKVYEGTTAELAADTTVFKSNEFVFDTEAGTLKKGNGVDTYADLSAIGGGGEGGAVAWGDITDVPVALTAAQAASTPSIRALGSTATTASPGTHNHPVTADAASGLAAAAIVQALAVALSARIKALEDAAV